ncbi:MAG: hypothetical protein P1V51_05360 [Deltaproteobacteria bacterium]|nr:hypothetical protein [Deltaproteobacteria bacterium]
MRLSVDEVLERSQWDFFWVPDDVSVVDRPELLYVSCRRDVAHLNAVTRWRAEPSRYDALLAEVLAAHEDVESRFMMVPHIERPELVDALLEHGYGVGDAHDAMAIEVDRYTPRPAGEIVTRRVETLEQLDDALRVTAVAFGKGIGIPPAQRAEALADCSGPGKRVFRVVAYDARSGEPLCAAGFTEFPELSFGLFWGGGTIPSGRGRGAYSAVVAARVEEAARRGLKRVGLYARLNTSAPICERQGFERHGRMVFWSRMP